MTPTGVVTNFGVGPMQVQDADFGSVLRITVERLNEGVVDPDYDFADHVTHAVTSRDVPLATWNATYAFNTDLKLINNAPLTLPGAVQGVALTTFERPDDEMPTPIPLDALQGTLDQIEGHFDWARPLIPADNPFAAQQADSEQVLVSTIASPAVSATRAAMIASLAAAGVPVSAEIDMSSTAHNAAAVLLAPPILCAVGGPVPAGVSA